MRPLLPSPFGVRLVVIVGALCSASSFAYAQESRSAFEVATIRMAQTSADPSTGSWSRPGVGIFTASHISFARLLQLAYGIDDGQIANRQSWMDSTLYDVNAKPEEGVSLTREELRPCLQQLLRERLHFVAHMESRLERGFALVVAPGGPHLQPASVVHFAGERHPVAPGRLHAYNCSMRQLAQYLSPAAGFPVADQTDLAGSYDIDFDYNPQAEADGDLPPLGLALKHATGLLLKRRNVSVQLLVVDSVEKVPTAN